MKMGFAVSKSDSAVMVVLIVVLVEKFENLFVLEAEEGVDVVLVKESFLQDLHAFWQDYLL